MSAGYRSNAARWLGGALSTPAPFGYRSLLAYWLGGACAGHEIIPPQPPVEEQHASGKKPRRKIYDEEDLAILIPCFLAVIEEDR